MPTQEPNHYWPADQFRVEPAVEVKPEAPLLPGRTIMPFELTTGQNHGRTLLFEPTFYEIPAEVTTDPKALKPKMDPETVRQSLGE